MTNTNNTNTVYLVGISAWIPSLQDGSPNADNFPSHIFSEEGKAREAYTELLAKCQKYDNAYLVKWDMLTDMYEILAGKL